VAFILLKLSLFPLDSPRKNGFMNTRFKLFAIAASAAVLSAAPAEAQNLTWFGSTACFGSPNPSNRVTVSNCNLSSSTSTTMYWDSNDGSSSRSTVNFQVNEYNNGGSSTDWPGGPASNSSTNRSLAFGAVGATQNLYLGYFDFNQVQGDDLVSANLSMNLTFANGAVALNDNLQIQGVEQYSCWPSNQNCWIYNNQPDGIMVAALGNPVAFSLGGYNYEFRYTGFDNWNNNTPNTTSNYCQGAVDNGLPATFTGDTQRKLCGSITYTGPTQVAEPATLTLVAAGFAGLVGVARRRRTAA
jgi:hypothetical protein